MYEFCLVDTYKVGLHSQVMYHRLWWWLEYKNRSMRLLEAPIGAWSYNLFEQNQLMEVTEYDMPFLDVQTNHVFIDGNGR